MVRAWLLISGEVQGVGYRWNCRRAASERALRGWVRNLPDGRVEAVGQGPKDDVEAWIAWCRRGPSGGRVDDVRVEWQPPGDDLERFEIR